MKRPYLNQEQRFFLYWNRNGVKTIFGSNLELELAWKKLQRVICKIINTLEIIYTNKFIETNL